MFKKKKEPVKDKKIVEQEFDFSIGVPSSLFTFLLKIIIEKRYTRYSTYITQLVPLTDDEVTTIGQYDDIFYDKKNNKLFIKNSFGSYEITSIPEETFCDVEIKSVTEKQTIEVQVDKKFMTYKKQT